MQRGRSNGHAMLYAPTECGDDGYPAAWHEHVKDWVREEAGNRCVRCLHPYRKGENGRGEWSACDAECRHAGPVRVDGVEFDEPMGDLAVATTVAHGAVVEAKWRILTVHHLNGLKYDCRWWNLAALCQRCHLQIQGKVKMDRAWPHEHSAWFKPYVAAYYAWTYLGEDLSREEAEARMDELLDLESRQLTFEC